MMKKAHLTIVLLIVIQFSLQAQTFLKNFGAIGKDEIELKQYSLNKDAEALVLFDIAKSYFDQKVNSFDVIFERSTRIKILSEAGIKWAEIEIPYYQEGTIFEKVYDVEAYSYNFENGQINRVPLQISNTYNEKMSEYWNVMKFAIPNVKEGSIIEYKYKISSQHKFNLRDWEFQWKIPVVYSEYELRMIPFYEYTWLLQGANKFDSQTSYVDKNSRQFGSVTFNDIVNKYTMKDIPAFDNEEFITSINDYIIKIDFQLSKVINPGGYTQNIISTWEDLNKELLRHSDFGKYVQKSEKLAAKLLGTEILSYINNKEKFDHVIQYVKANYNWDENYGKYATKSPSKFIKERHGNSADINLFTIGLLIASGIDAKPVLISTRGNGSVKFDYPFSHFFNYVIILANIDGVNVLTDATEVLSLNNRVPSRCLNDRGLIIQKDKVEWINLECRFASETKTDIQIEVIDNEILNSSITKTATEYDALNYRNNYSDNIQTIKKIIESKDYVITEPSILVQNQLTIDEPYVLTYQQTSKPEIVNQKIYLSPLLNEALSDNPLKQKERTYPINMTYPKRRIFTSTILIPEDFKVDYLPSEQNINNQLFELKYTVNSDDKQIIISFDYYFKKSVYSSEDYLNIKSYFDEIVKKVNEKVVLSKK